MSLEHMQAYVITKRSSNFNYNLRVDVQIPALNINRPAGHLLHRPLHHDHYHVHDHRRTGRGGAGGAAAPPIRAVCRHEFGQRVDNIRAKHNTCLKNTNLGSVTAVNGKKHEFWVCYCS